MTLIELRRKLKAIQAEMRKLSEESGSLSGEEFKTKVDELKHQRSDLETKIELAEQLEADDQAAANEEGLRRERANRETEQSKIRKRYSILAAMRMAAGSEPLAGVEKEMHELATEEARNDGKPMEGNLRIPSMLIRNNHEEPERRTTMVAGTANVGGNAISTDLSTDVIPFLDPQLQVEALGATVLTGLVGNVDIPKQTGISTAVWASEIAAATETNPTIGLVQLRAKRLTAFTPISKTLMLQNSFSVEQMVRRDLNRAIRIAWDKAAINGTGSSNQPTGILNLAGIGAVVGGTNGLAPTLSHMIKLETELAVDDADMGFLAYLTTPGIRGKLKETEMYSAGTGNPVWKGGMTNEYKAVVSTQVPSTLTKGSSSGICHAIIFGNWAELLLAQWGGLDITVDPYSRSKEAIVELVVHSWVDVGVRHEQSFAAMKDALIS